MNVLAGAAPVIVARSLVLVRHAGLPPALADAAFLVGSLFVWTCLIAMLVEPALNGWHVRTKPVLDRRVALGYAVTIFALIATMVASGLASTVR